MTPPLAPLRYAGELRLFDIITQLVLSTKHKKKLPEVCCRMQVRKFADELRFFDTLFLATDFKFLDGLHPSKGFDRLKISTKGISVVKRPVPTDVKTKQLQDVLKRKAATGSLKIKYENAKKSIFTCAKLQQMLRLHGWELRRPRTSYPRRN